jgi:hypothetical protein
MRGDFAQTVETVRTASWLAHERACDVLLPDPARLRPLAMRWLDGHLPLTLVMDLSMPHGPHSDELLAGEPEPQTAW